MLSITNPAILIISSGSTPLQMMNSCLVDLASAHLTVRTACHQLSDSHRTRTASGFYFLYWLEVLLVPAVTVVGNHSRNRVHAIVRVSLMII